MARTAGSKNKPKQWPEDAKKIENDPEIKNAVDAEDVDTKKIKTNGTSKVQPGVPADENGTKGLWDVDSPSPEWEEELAKFDVKALDPNARKIAKRLDKRHDFLVLGEAGWAKTSVIEEQAKRWGYHILTVYLDKAVASDLGGIPVPAETTDARGNKRLYMQYSAPGWAIYMAEHPNDKFLLFFDEMNQAAPDVLNALMPIVLKHVVCGIQFDNMIVGAAGNLAHENDSLSEINKPLRDRFKPIITWDTHSEPSWDGTFMYLHKKFDSKVGKKTIDMLDELREVWNSPRDITRVMLEFTMGKGDYKNDAWTDADDILEEIKSCIWDDVDISPSQEKKLEKLADYMSQAIKGEVKDEEDNSRKKNKGTDQVNDNDKKEIISSLVKGYWFNSKANDPENGDDEKYVCTVENAITSIFPPELTGVTAEVFKKILKEMEADGKKPRYQTNEEGFKDCKKNGWHTIETKNGVDYIDGEKVG